MSDDKPCCTTRCTCKRGKRSHDPAFVGAFMAAYDKANATEEMQHVRGYPYRVHPRKDLRDED